MTLEIERLYVELALEVTGQVPELAHPIEGLAGAAGPGSDPSVTKAPTSAARGGLLGRFFGR